MYIETLKPDYNVSMHTWSNKVCFKKLFCYELNPSETISSLLVLHDTCVICPTFLGESIFLNIVRDFVRIA